MKKWTDKEIQGMKPKSKSYDQREKSGNGFGVTIFPTGEKSFFYIYTFQGRKRRMTLAKYSSCSLGEARKLHRAALVVLERGKDPAEERRKQKIVIRDAYTVNALIDEYIEKWAKPNKRSWKADESCLKRDIKPLWGKRKANEITRREVIVLLDGIKERGAPVQANRVLACIRKMFNFAIERDLLTANPCSGVRPVTKENKRDRVLSEEEIKILWFALSHIHEVNQSHDLHMSLETMLVLKLQLVTAQRKGELISAEWDEIDFASGWWTIPASKAKNKQAHRVPLSSLAVELLNEVKVLSGNSRYLFPAKHKNAHITDSSIDKAVKRSIFEGIKPWTPHDLRRTAASHMTSIGILRLVVSKILNHSEQSITAVYDRHSYDNEKRSALETWANKLQEIIYSDTSLVVTLELSDDKEMV
ncbi:site-specific integrase [Legionella longbeachae]|uniref:tyrosine-type recombinase/integrase n=1 Tax=Legionella longbeachae TaxID=450 RepID=UPI0009B791A2|nr:site-specific integrase [Legionella longbeachae]ARB92852.1 site-specific integrase [Legionella longbeachae]RZV26502.1 site-specific integrase [Legionella longbeachae]UAK47259.1 tyrosine-type recombinase/integrase [Legionella longbeachae]VEE04325.1 phage integrase-like protein [Legionella oakridgensis]